MDSENLLQHRVSRLEAVVAALLAADRDISRFELDRLLRTHLGPEEEDEDRFLYLIQRMFRRRRYPWIEDRESLEESFAEIRQDLAQQRNTVTELHRSAKQLQVDAHAVFAMQSLGIDLDRVILPRFLPVRIYLDRHDTVAVVRLSEALRDALRAFDLEVADDFPAKEGSWFKKWFSRTKEAVTSDVAKDIGRKVVRGAELAGLEKPQADINKTQAEALGILLERAKEFGSAAIQCGTALLVVLSDGDGRKNVVAVTLTPSQMIAIENNQQLLFSPATVLEQLKLVCAEGSRRQSS